MFLATLFNLLWHILHTTGQNFIACCEWPIIEQTIEPFGHTEWPNIEQTIEPFGHTDFVHRQSYSDKYFIWICERDHS